MKKTAIELWDAYYENGTPANRDLVRGQPIPKGLYHLVSEVLVRHADGDYLLMQRDPRKPHFGGFFEATAGGSALRARTVFPAPKESYWKKRAFQTAD